MTNKGPVEKAFIAVTFFVLIFPIGMIHIWLAKKIGILIFYPILDRMTTLEERLDMFASGESFLWLITTIYFVYSLMLLPAKMIVYRRTILIRKNLRWDFLLYAVVPLFAWLFLPEVHGTLALAIIATSAWVEVFKQPLLDYLQPPKPPGKQ